MRKRSIFGQKTWTNPFSKCRFFFSLLKVNFSGLKSILFYPEYQKMFLSGVFAKKKHMRKKSIFWEKQLTNPFAKLRFFLLSQNFTFEVQKALFSNRNIKKCFFLALWLKKKTYKKKVDFLTKNHGLQTFKNIHFLKFFRTLL